MGRRRSGTGTGVVRIDVDVDIPDAVIACDGSFIAGNDSAS